MLDWCYEDVLRRHAEERAKREADARFFVEKWLEALVGPYLTGPAPLPQRFEGNLSFFSNQEKYNSTEVVNMAKKLGWSMQVTLPPDGCTVAVVSVWQALRVHEPTLDSKWDVAAVRAQKKSNDEEYLNDVRAVISKTVGRCIGSLDGIPTLIPLDVTGDWVKEHKDALAVLGWQAGAGPVDGFFYLRKA
jgi:hypothetical protein